MIITKQIKQIWSTKNKSRFEKKGYHFTNYGDEFYINIIDAIGKEKVEVECDCCHEKIIMSKQSFFKKRNINDNYYCKTCVNRGKKTAKELNNDSGIYKITNKVNGKVYIGQSKNIKSRWNSYKSFVKNPNKKEPILIAMRKYGMENFDFEILEKCNIKDLDKLEKKYIKQYNSCRYFKNSNGYNADEGGSLKTSKRTGRIGRKVMCITTGIEYETANEAERLTGISSSSIRRCCRGNMKQVKNTKWKYVEQENELDKINKKLQQYKNDIPIELYDLINEYIIKNNKKEYKTTANAKPVLCIETNKLYPSVEKTALDFGVSSGSIRDVLIKRTKSVKSKIDGKNYTFRYV